ncbi:MAG: fibronectin type III domain-containing protein, partial [Actinomycetota bacterium]
MAVCLTQPLPAAAVQIAHPAVVSDDPVNWTPNVLDGRVLAIAQIGSKVVVGGTFTQVQRAGTTQTVQRSRLFAFDMNTGAIDPNFVPQLSGTVEAVVPAPDGLSVYVGGSFGSTNGNTSYRRLVRLNLSNGQLVTAFRPNPAASVRALVLRGPWLYASGTFQRMGPLTRPGVARVDPTTGTVDAAFDLPFAGPQNGGGLNVRKIDVTPDGSRLIAIGNFTTVAGQPRTQIAMIDLTTGPPSLSTWQTSQFPFYSSGTTTWCSSAFDSYMHDVDISPDGRYFVVVTTGAYRANRLCDSVTRWEIAAAGPDQLPTWVDWSGGDTFWGVGVTGSAIYVGGHPRWVNNPYRGDNPGPGAVPREGIAALDPVNGLPFSWNPGRARGVGTFDLVGTPDGLFVGSDTERFAGELRQRLAFLPLTGGTTPPPNLTYPLPNDLYRIDAATSTLSRRPFDGTVTGSPTTVATGIDWSTTRGAFAVDGRVYMGLSDGTFAWRPFDGSTMGSVDPIGLYGLDTAPPSTFLIPGTTTPVPAFSTHLASTTGMFFDSGRIYYTVSGDARLYYRYFTPESLVVGANLFVGSTNTAVDWANVRGMTMASGNLFYALANGDLFRIAWSGGQPTGSPILIGGPAIDGLDWSSRALFVFSASGDLAGPTTPGVPVGQSTGFDSIDLTWSASSDQSEPITYRVFRDGGASPVGSVQSSSATTVSFSDTGLVAGSTHTYGIQPVDAVGNAGPMSPDSGPITVLAPEQDPPSRPGTPVGNSTGSSAITLTWGPSTDASLPITYSVYRDGGVQAVGSTTSTTFTDTGLAAGSTHTYVIEPEDAQGNVGDRSDPSEPITVPAAVFADGFASGSFVNWTSVTNLTIDATRGAPVAPSARGAPVGRPAFAYRDLGTGITSICVGVRVDLQAQQGTGVDLIRLRTASDGPVVKVFVNTSGILRIRSDFNGAQRSSGVVIGSGWHRIELCGS